MKKLILLVLTALGLQATPALVGGQIADGSGFGGVAAAAFPGNNVAGHFILADGVMLSGATPTIGDIQGNIYQSLVASNDNGSTLIVMFVAYNIKAGANTVTLTQSGGGVIRVHISEFSGVATTSAKDQANNANSVSSGTVGPTLATTQNGELIVGFGFNAAGGATIGMGFTVINNFGPATDVDEYLVQSTCGSIPVQFSIATSSTWQVLAASFKAAGASGCTVKSNTAAHGGIL